MEPLKYDEFLEKWIKEKLSHKTKEEIEDFFGIEIKSAGEHGRIPMYNIYIKGTELVYPWVFEGNLEDGILQEGIESMIRILSDNALEDTKSNKRAAQKINEEWEKQRAEEHKSSLEYCPKCGCCYPRGLHFH